MSKVRTLVNAVRLGNGYFLRAVCLPNFTLPDRKNFPTRLTEPRVMNRKFTTPAKSTIQSRIMNRKFITPAQTATQSRIMNRKFITPAQIHHTEPNYEPKIHNSCPNRHTEPNYEPKVRNGCFKRHRFGFPNRIARNPGAECEILLKRKRWPRLLSKGPSHMILHPIDSDLPLPAQAHDRATLARSGPATAYTAPAWRRAGGCLPCRRTVAAAPSVQTARVRPVPGKRALPASLRRRPDRPRR